MNKGDIIIKILDYFKENEDEFNECMEELDSYNGYLGDDRYYFMEDLDEIYHGEHPTEILTRAFYGYDADSCYIDNYGEKHYEAFNPNREYFTFNGYGNLVSADYKDYSAYLDNYAVSEIADHRHYIYAVEEHIELSMLFDELEEAEEE